jgi:CRISPR-associated protein Csm1
MTRETIYLAALLHDIGKFWQRADDSLNETKQLSINSKNLAGQICPLNADSSFGYQHVVWTHQFFEKFEHIFNEVRKDNVPIFRINKFDNGQEKLDNLVNLSIYHHKPFTQMQAIIQMADWWSSGIDRREENMETEEASALEPLKYGRKKYKKVPLFSLFPEIVIVKNKGLFHATHSLTKLDLDVNKSCFSKKFEQADIKDLQQDYNTLWKGFISEVEKLPINSVSGFTESLFFLLKKYTWCIPSSTRDMANVSLFEHLKSTATIADCLFEYHRTNSDDFTFDEQKKRLIVKEDKYPLLMLCADLSGIQNFIYNIATAKASVSMKGRSFYLQLVIESVIQKIVMGTGATIGHVIYSSGGKFYMLLPNTEEVVKRLEIIRNEIEAKIWEEQKMKLYLCMDWIPFCYRTGNQSEDARIESPEKTSNQKDIIFLNDLWKAVSDKASAHKSRKFDNKLVHKFSQFFGENNQGLNVGGKESVCAVTGEEGKLVKVKGEEGLLVLPVVNTQIELGRTLKDADYVLTHKHGEERGISYLAKPSKVNIDPLNLNFHQYLFDQEQLAINDAEWREINSADTARVRRINTTDFLSIDKLKGKGVSYGFLFYGGNKQAEKESGEEKTFHDLARNDEGNPTYLGVLRMDVDGLGQIFQHGLPENLRTFSAYATLSGSLDYFFSGWLNTLRNKQPFKDWVNIIYSGGDDLFVVGRWAEVIDFAAEIRSAFQEFVGGREDLSVSGGIVFIHEKFPISLAAEQAGEAEKKAKSFENACLSVIDKGRNIPISKNAITLWGEAISWNEQEFHFVKNTRNELLHWYEANKITKGFLHKLIDLKLKKDYMIQQQKSGDKIKNDYSYRWNAAYYIARFLERFEKDKPENRAIRQFLHDLKDKLFNQDIGNDRYFDLIATAARWTEFHIKESINIKN